MFVLTTLSACISLAVAVAVKKPAKTSPFYTKCPSYTDIYDQVAMRNFEQESYQGEWYAIAHNEPTEPEFCTCDRLTWKITKKAEYSNTLQAHCKKSWVDFELNLHLSGQTAKNTSLQGLRTEGAPPLAKWIPNMVLYVEENPRAGRDEYRYLYAIVFSCAEKYLFQDVFTSLQIFSRDPFVGKSEIQRLVDKAAEMIKFDPNGLKFPQSPDCTYPKSLLDLPKNCGKEDICIPGMYGIKGVPEPRIASK